MILAGFLSLTLLSADAGLAADGASEVLVKVGETARVDVSGLRGVMCDDLDIMTPTMEGGTSSNALLVTGLKPGRTTCRVGTNSGDGRFRIVRITVIKK